MVLGYSLGGRRLRYESDKGLVKGGGMCSDSRKALKRVTKNDIILLENF